MADVVDPEGQAEHNRSLRGAAKPFIRRHAPPEEEWDDLVAEAIAEDLANVWAYVRSQRNEIDEQIRANEEA